MVGGPTVKAEPQIFADEEGFDLILYERTLDHRALDAER